MNELIGLVVCGGQSSRMGTDKSLIEYYNKPQRYYLYEMLQPMCDKVFISCNKNQSVTISRDYTKIVDLEEFENIGPMAALLSAYVSHPNSDFILIGCDYPFITSMDIQKLIKERVENYDAIAFVNKENGFEEPLLAVYSNKCLVSLLKRFNNNEYSLRHFLKSISTKLITADYPETIVSIDTPDKFNEVVSEIKAKTTYA